MCNFIMTKFSYEDHAKELGAAIDIAIESVKKYPPINHKPEHVDHFVNTYLKFKIDVLNPKDMYRNSKSFAYLKEEVLFYFQEASGDTVNYFWNRIKESKLNFKRENKMAKILKRQRIKNGIEYDFVIDVLVPYIEEGLLSDKEVNQLNKYILEFENKRK
jgi:hypothetical protein